MSIKLIFEILSHHVTKYHACAENYLRSKKVSHSICRRDTRTTDA